MVKSSFVSKMLTTRVLGTAALATAFLASGAMVMGGSTAAFSGTTSNQSSWDAGVVSLTNNHASALFSGLEIVPGYAETHCMSVKSEATVPTTLKMYADTTADLASLLDSKLQVTVSEGHSGVNTDGIAGSCVGFVSTSEKFTGTLAEFKTRNSFTNGLASTNLPAGASQQYKISVTLPQSVGNEVQGATSSVKFAWENRS